MINLLLKNRKGESVTTFQGYKAEIIEYVNASNMSVLIDDKYILHKIRYCRFKEGIVINPYHKSVANTGFTGIGKYKTMDGGNKQLAVYKLWAGMINRCYSEVLNKQKPTYKDVTVHPDWHNFQNFAKWFEENYIEGFHLDKDILCKDCKEYSADNCCFVPREINNLFTLRNNKRGDYPIGVHKNKYSYYTSITINNKCVNLGSFKKVEDAFQAYKQEKEKQIKILAEKWKSKIKVEVYEALINYEVKITD